MKKIVLFCCIGILTASLLFLLYEVGGTGNSPETPVLVTPEAASLSTTQTAAPNATAEAPSHLLKGSGKFLSGELEETGGFLLSIQDELEAEKRYLVPPGLMVQKGETGIQPSELQKEDILDIDYFLSEKGERIVTHLDVVIAAKEKEIQVEAPTLESKPSEAPDGPH